MRFDIPFNFLKIIGGMESRNWKSVSEAKSAREENIRLELTVAPS